MDATKGANPFLMMGGDDYSSPPSNNSNPFLMDSTAFAASEAPIFDNPFLAQPEPTATAPENNIAPANNATNPFAFDAMDYGPPEAAPAEVHSALPTETNDIFGNSMMSEPKPMMETTTVDFFSMEDNTDSCKINPEPVVLQKPAALDLKHTNTVTRVEENVHMYSSDEELTKAAPPPRRPPPPRPNVPPGTKELLMSVTGAMDATSSHLLDRIPPTRTPSPVSMRDLHSPSPTPEHAFADFLDVGNNKPQQMQNQEVDFFDLNDSNDIQPANIQQPVNPPTSNSDMMSLISNDPVCDINQNHSINQQPQQPPIQPPTQLPIQPPMHLPIQPPMQLPIQPAMQLPIQPSMQPPIQPPMQQPMQPPMQAPMKPPPPRPQPPVKPPPPMVRPNLPTERPKPPLPPQPIAKPAQPNDDMMDMMGDSDLPPPEPKPVEKPVASTADIMSLYSSPPVVAKPEPIVDLLSESNEVNPPISSAPESIISPEVSSQHDLNMDTSDTQSKGSASSVTFNPFAAEEIATPIAVDSITPEKIQNDNFMPSNDMFSNLPETTTTTTNDIFSQPQEVANTTTTDIFSTQPIVTNTDIFSNQETIPSTDMFAPQQEITNINTNSNANIQNNSFFDQTVDDFDDFAAKFESAAKEDSKNGFDPFGGNNNSAWGNTSDDQGFASGFDADEPFDAFLSLQEPPAVPQHTPSMLSKRESQESDEDKDFSVFIKPKADDDGTIPDIAMPVLAPPPKSPVQNAFNDNSPRFNPFDQQTENVSSAANQLGALPLGGQQFERTDSQETPPTPLFDDDVSQPLEDFPRVTWAEEGWELQLRQPNKKKITGQRFWKKIFVKLIMHEDVPILQLFNANTDKDPFQELPLQPCYSVSDIGAQQYDNYGKIFTVKLQYVFYKERPGVRPGQVTKAERITNKLSQFAAYAIQGDYQGVKEFGSDLKKLGLPVEHAPQVSQLLKIGSLKYEDMKQFSVTIEEALFRLSAHRDRALHYKMEEVQVTAVDELYVEQNCEGIVEKQIARVRLFFLGFLSGMPDVELGVNDMRRQGKEVVGRHDIIPVVTEEWIRLEATEFHSCVQQDEYSNTHIIKFKPPDACYIELMRFRIRPPKNRELPLQLKPVMCITGNKVEIRADVLVPGFASRKLGQVPCEDVQIRIPIPECWIYLFRVEKHFRYGSVKSAHRRTGKVKGLERFLGTVETLQESLIEVTSGQAKYEHQHRAIVWRIPRLPKEGQGAYTTHNLVCRMALTSYDQVPDHLAEYCYVEFTMPATQASHTTVRSVSLQNSQSDDPPEKYVRYLARHEYRVGIEHTEGEDPNAYAAATVVSRPAPVQEEPTPVPVVAAVTDADSSSDSD